MKYTVDTDAKTIIIESGEAHEISEVLKMFAGFMVVSKENTHYYPYPYYPYYWSYTDGTLSTTGMEGDFDWQNNSTSDVSVKEYPHTLTNNDLNIN